MKKEQMIKTALGNIQSLWKKEEEHMKKGEEDGERFRKIRELSGVSSPCPKQSLDTVW